MGNPFDIVRRAQASQPLTAAERAVNKIIKTVVPAVVVATVTALSDMVVIQHNFDPRALFLGCGGAALITAYIGLAKFLSASTDPAARVVGDALTAEESAVEKALGYNDPKQPAAPDATPEPAPAPAPDPAPVA